MKKERIVYFDYLRVFATVAVVILHAAAQNWYFADPSGLDWNILNFYDSIVRWGVPAFIMISGALFLSRDISIKALYSKNILRMFVSFFVWAAFYAFSNSLIEFAFGGVFSFSTKDVILNTLTGNYHMWFIPMIIGLYMSVPILKEILKSKSTTKYFIVLSFIFAFVVPQITYMSKDFIG